jgi:prolyl oligopeptidase PreP (S9A serine peptidase family)
LIDCFYLKVTSRTAKKEATESGLPKWDLYFKWDMNGIETHMDPSIGKIISNLSDAMTLFTGEEGDSEANDEVFRPKHGRNRARLMEEQMQIHAKIFSELQSEGASQQDIQTEAEKLKRIEQGIVHEIRRDFVSRIRQKSISSRGSMSEYRSHRRTSSTPQSDLSPTTPEADAAHGRTFSVDLAKARSNLQTPLSL